MRRFEHTPEPPPGLSARSGPLTFVVQKHRASRLHYDLRLEVDGVLKSWPVPKGPSTDPSDRRLAVMTEDHPLDYGAFEGIIPRGEYGAGEVIVWDRGTYSPDEGGRLSFDDPDEANRRMREAIAGGKLSVTLRGHRMKGSWSLVKTAREDDGWLLLKHGDDAADRDRELVREGSSVISGLTIEDLQAGRRPPEGEPPPLDPARLPGAISAPPARDLLPMQATLMDGPFSDPRWLFEPKLDGVRALALVEQGRVTLRSRRGLEMSHQYPALVTALGRQPVDRALFDGEIVAFDARGVPSFERLQQRLNLQNDVEIRQADRDVPVLFYVFDLLYLDGVDLRGVPLEERKRLLQRTLLPSGWVQPLDHVLADGEAAFAGARDLGLEGVMAKRRDSRYEAGRRSRHWGKLKVRTTDDFVVCGYTVGQGGRAHSFGALVLGTRDDGGELVHVGQVGSGFDERSLRETLERLEPLREETRTVDLRGAGTVQVTWVRPEVVVEVEYAHYTADGQLRAPVFKRLRPDKDASDVRRESDDRTLAPSAPPAGRPRPEDEIEAVLDQLQSPRKQFPIEVGGNRISLTNLDKPMWPAHGGEPPVTKRELIAYYARISPQLLPQLRDRPLTFTRYPNGIEGSFFYQKHVEQLPGDFVETITAHTEGGDQRFVVVNNLATLVWLGQMADLALHTSLARAHPEPDGHHLSTTFTGSREQVERSLLNYPDFVLFDIDPYIYAGHEGQGEEPEFNPRAFDATCRVTLWLKELLDGAGLSAFVKTSGATGLHVYVPILRRFDYETVRGVAETFGGFLLRAHPREITMEWSVERRTGKVFIDVNQNARNKNLACAYSPRAKPGAPVSMPLRWDELGRIDPTEFTIRTAQARLETAGDLWANTLDAKNDLHAVLGLDTG